MIAIGIATFIFLIRDSEKPAREFELAAKEWEANGSGNGRQTALRPLLFPCRTTHSRIFPKRHSFDYSYLLVGIPIPWDGRRGGLLSVEVESGFGKKGKKRLLHVNAKDYLERGRAELGLFGKLREYLRSQGIADDDWRYAYLVTAPRFWGYSFNPVSFWYIYDHEQELTMMILEVNNTFDERRMYLLQAIPDDSETAESGVLENGHRGHCVRATKKFTNSWLKDFHVSPFNSRKGSYHLKAIDPFSNGNSSGIDNTITLQSSKGYPKLVARVFSSDSPLDPTRLTFWEYFRFLTGWWWVGLVTFPRILREAAKLFFVKKLHVWFRPEVSLNSIGRNATNTEIALELFFEKYLSSLVSSAAEPLHVVYKPAVGNYVVKKYKSPSASSPAASLKKLEIRVMTPAFYSRFIHYAHTSEAFDRECLCTDQKNRTVWISNPEILPALLPKTPEAWNVNPRSGFDQVRWAFLRWSRCRPTAPAYPITPIACQNHNTSIEDIRSIPFSDLDRFVQSSYSDAWVYRRNAVKSFLAQRFAFGVIEVVAFADILFRVLLVLCTQVPIPYWTLQSEKFGVPSSIGMARYLAQLVQMSGVHIWAFFKGWN
ncbi:hypothetical protein AOQ84DRAFT_336611 [Glonium stellatum]|uniref:Uncharacterized protein n=1 Tax=Glonium stellatum TaxID=574774 RepID=A0A8E2JVR9_9PEZI|nr:hypothetical protein AOQ84DRAFT_336611 [Glonium stellatum]